MNPLSDEQLALIAQRIERKADNITDRRRLVAEVERLRGALAAQPQPQNEPFLTTRGFWRFAPIDIGGERRFTAYESSAATEPMVWLRVIDDHGEAYAHMTIDHARELARQMVWLCEHHRMVDTVAGQAGYRTAITEGVNQCT